MESMSLSFESLMVYLNRAISQISEPRQSSNGKRYSLQDSILGVISLAPEFITPQDVHEKQSLRSSGS
jgi:hypothetical protein